MLREDVVAAVRERRFHVFAVTTVDEALALVTGREAGVRGADGTYPTDSLNAAVERALARNLETLRELRAARGGHNGQPMREIAPFPVSAAVPHFEEEQP